MRGLPWLLASRHPRPAGDYTQRQVSIWSNNYRAAITTGEVPRPSMERLMSWLPSNMPHGQQPRTIVHGDYRIDNVVFHPTEVRSKLL